MSLRKTAFEKPKGKNLTWKCSKYFLSFFLYSRSNLSTEPHPDLFHTPRKVILGRNHPVHEDISHSSCFITNQATAFGNAGATNVPSPGAKSLRPEPGLCSHCCECSCYQCNQSRSSRAGWQKTPTDRSGDTANLAPAMHDGVLMSSWTLSDALLHGWGDSSFPGRSSL